MKVFIAGAGGFIGRNLTEFLTKSGYEILPHVRSEHGELSKDHVPADVDAVVNCAGRLGGQGASSDELLRSNIYLPTMLAETCLESGISFIHLSTPGIAGLRADIKEEDPKDPWGKYEKTKAEAEERIQSILSPELLTILRPDFVYGPGDTHKLALFRQVWKRWFPIIGRDGARVRPTYVTDVCRALEFAISGKFGVNGIFNIGGPKVVTIRKLVKMIAKENGNRLLIFSLPSTFFKLALLLGPLRPGELTESRLALFERDHFVSTELAEKSGFIPEIDLATGLKRTIDWYRKKGYLA